MVCVSSGEFSTAAFSTTAIFSSAKARAKGSFTENDSPSIFSTSAYVFSEDFVSPAYPKNSSVSGFSNGRNSILHPSCTTSIVSVSRSVLTVTTAVRRKPSLTEAVTVTVMGSSDAVPDDLSSVSHFWSDSAVQSRLETTVKDAEPPSFEISSRGCSSESVRLP